MDEVVQSDNATKPDEHRREDPHEANQQYEVHPARLERGVDVRVELRPLPAFGRDVHRLHPVRSRALEDDRVFDVAHHDRDLAIGGEVNFAHLFPFSFEGITLWA
jgi:hypothetical protein